MGLSSIERSVADPPCSGFARGKRGVEVCGQGCHFICPQLFLETPDGILVGTRIATSPTTGSQETEPVEGLELSMFGNQEFS